MSAAPSTLHGLDITNLHPAWVASTPPPEHLTTLLTTDISCGDAAGAVCSNPETYTPPPPVVEYTNIPIPVASLHRTVLKGPLLLQLTEGVDIGNPPVNTAAAPELVLPPPEDDGEEDDDYVEHHTAGTRNARRGPRLLRLVLHDGFQAVHALETHPQPALDALLPGGKMVVSNVSVRRGHLLLDENVSIRVLGGEVSDWGTAPPSQAQIRDRAARNITEIVLDDEDDFV